jgi:hypothetical protein
MKTSLPQESSSNLTTQFEQMPEALIDFDHDYCFVNKSGENSQMPSETSSVVSACSINDMKIVIEDSSSSHTSDISELYANVTVDVSLDNGSVLKALLISGNRENTQKALAEAAKQSAQKTDDCEDEVQVNIEEIENFKMSEKKALQNKNMFKGKEHRNYRKKDNEQEDNTFDKVPGYFTTLSRPMKSSKQDILAVSASSDSQTIDRDVSPERQNCTGFSKLPAYHNCFTNSTKYDRGTYILSASEEEAIRNAVLGQRRRNNRRSRSRYSSRSPSSSSCSGSSRSSSRSRSRSNSRYILFLVAV